MGPVGRYPKRAIDAIIAATALLVLSPVLAATAVTVLVMLGRPIFFTQMRPGLNGKPFRLIKFRSMRQPAAASAANDDAQRLTRFGRWLRATSLDELPELWNVLRGEMSLVGPRPLLMHYLELYTPFQHRRHEVRPGLTGWAQVNGRNALTWPEKFALDVWYVENLGFRTDLKIILLTIARVAGRHGITAADSATTPYFQCETGDENGPVRRAAADPARTGKIAPRQ